MSRVASGLLSTVRVMGALPIIRYVRAHMWCDASCNCCTLVMVVVLTEQWQPLACRLSRICLSVLPSGTHIDAPPEARRRCSHRN
jgi:hypothetical protein